MGERPEISREFIELHRRRRFAAAAAEIAHEFGIGGIKISTLVRRAGAARNTFYELFSNRADCLRFAIDDACDRLFEPVHAVAGEGDWAPRTEAGIGGFYAAVGADPLAAELLLVHSFGVELGSANVGFESGAEAIEQLLLGGRAAGAARGRAPVPALAEEYLARVVLAVAIRAIRREEVAALPGLSHEVGLLVSTVYLGPEAAAAELGVPPG